MYNLPGAHQIKFDGLLNLPNAIIKRLSHFQFRPPSRAEVGGGGELPYKSEEDARRLRGVVVTCRFWSYFGCLRRKVTIFAHAWIP